MARTKAAFRATREMVGMTQAALADKLGVEVRSVKRWESPTAPQVPPPDAWAILDAALERQRDVVRYGRANVHDIIDERGEHPTAVMLPYYSSAEEWAAFCRGMRQTVDWRMTNANARALACVLWADGLEVTWGDRLEVIQH